MEMALTLYIIYNVYSGRVPFPVIIKNLIVMKNHKCLLNSMLLVAALSGFSGSAYADDGKIVFSGNMG